MKFAKCLLIGAILAGLTVPAGAVWKVRDPIEGYEFPGQPETIDFSGNRDSNEEGQLQVGIYVPGDDYYAVVFQDSVVGGGVNTWSYSHTWGGGNFSDESLWRVGQYSAQCVQDDTYHDVPIIFTIVDDFTINN